MIRLFTTFYREQRRERLAEYIECLNRNLACAAIDEVCVLVEASEDILPASGKLNTRRLAHRPLYDDFFRWIAERAGPDDVSIISNSDIWFDSSVGAASKALGAHDCFALARWDEGRLFDRNDSQDCWFFRGPVTRVQGDFPIGVPRCDNRFLYELQRAGYNVTNPSFSIKAHHVHGGERGEYGGTGLANAVSEPYRYVWPHNLWSAPRTAWHNVTHPWERVGWKLDRRKVQRTLPFRAAGKLFRLTTEARPRDRDGTPRR